MRNSDWGPKFPTSAFTNDDDDSCGGGVGDDDDDERCDTDEL